jgi:hypothetical protein
MLNIFKLVSGITHILFRVDENSTLNVPLLFPTSIIKARTARFEKKKVALANFEFGSGQNPAPVATEPPSSPDHGRSDKTLVAFSTTMSQRVRRSLQGKSAV